MAEGMGLDIGIMGKHPGYGDFLSYGLSDATAKGFQSWLDKTLHAQRKEMGDKWEAFWDAGQSLRFWVGRALSGRTLAGVLKPSRDKVGRRYPFVLMAEGVSLAAPVLKPDQTFYEVLEEHIRHMKPGHGASSLMTGLNAEAVPAEAETEADQAAGPLIWAHHPEGDLAALLDAAGPVDRERAITTRSYWWAPGRDGMAAIWLGQAGMPDAAALGWLLTGQAGQPAAKETEVEKPDA